MPWQEVSTVSLRQEFVVPATADGANDSPHPFPLLQWEQWDRLARVANSRGREQGRGVSRED